MSRPTQITLEQLQSLEEPPGTASAKRTQSMIQSLNRWLIHQPPLTPTQTQKIHRWVQILIRRAIHQSQAKVLNAEKYHHDIPAIQHPDYPLIVDLIPVKQADNSYRVLIRYPYISVRLQRREIRQLKGPLNYHVPPIHEIPITVDSLEQLQARLLTCENLDTHEARLIRRRIRQIKDMLGIAR